MPFPVPTAASMWNVCKRNEKLGTFALYCYSLGTVAFCLLCDLIKNAAAYKADLKQFIVVFLTCYSCYGNGDNRGSQDILWLIATFGLTAS